MDTCMTMATFGIRAISGGIVKTSKLSICRQSQRTRPSRLVTRPELCNTASGPSKTIDRPFSRENARFRDSLHYFRTDICLCTLNSDFSGRSSDDSDSGEIDGVSGYKSESGEANGAQQPQDAVLQAISGKKLSSKELPHQLYI